MTAAADLLPGDFIQARMRGDTPADAPEQWLVTEFTVTAVTGTTVTGNVLYPAGLDESTGWTFDLIGRPPVGLPTVLSEVVASLTDGTARTLMGKGPVWSAADTGEPVPVDQILSFTPAS